MKIICHTHQLVNPLPQLISEKETPERFHLSVCDSDGRLDFRLAALPPRRARWFTSFPSWQWFRSSYTVCARQLLCL